jgi:sec-independent protein translocase protein TatA
MPRLGPTELMIVLIIVILLFGVGRIGKIAGELGKGISEFRKGLRSADDKESTHEEEPIDTKKDI